MHPDQDEWLYILDGEFEFEVGGKERFRAGPGESVFLPRGVQHSWISTTLKPGKVLNVYQPAGRRSLGTHAGTARIPSWAKAVFRFDVAQPKTAQAVFCRSKSRPCRKNDLGGRFFCGPSRYGEAKTAIKAGISRTSYFIA